LNEIAWFVSDGQEIYLYYKIMDVRLPWLRRLLHGRTGYNQFESFPNLGYIAHAV
jgi:hypothetical protein